jgi:L-alanine-DL-glutamate epimerase-like enolase superfamily enzyme
MCACPGAKLEWASPSMTKSVNRAVPAAAGQAATLSVALKLGKQPQEQIQTIATAIGRPAARAPAIVNVNAANRFASGRSWSIDMLLAPPHG